MDKCSQFTLYLQTILEINYLYLISTLSGCQKSGTDKHVFYLSLGKYVSSNVILMCKSTSLPKIKE